MKNFLFAISLLGLLCSCIAQETQRVDLYPPYHNIRTLSVPNNPAAILNDVYVTSPNGGAIRATIDGVDSIIVLLNRLLDDEPAIVGCESDSFYITQSSLIFSSVALIEDTCSDTTYISIIPNIIIAPADTETYQAQVSSYDTDDILLGQSITCESIDNKNYFYPPDFFEYIDSSYYSILLIATTETQDTSAYNYSSDGFNSYYLVVTDVKLVGECKDEIEVSYIKASSLPTINFARTTNLSFLVSEEDAPEFLEEVSSNDITGKLKLPITEGKSSFIIYSDDFISAFAFQITTSTD